MIICNGKYIRAKNGLVLPYEPTRKRSGRHIVLQAIDGKWFVARLGKPLRFQPK